MTSKTLLQVNLGGIATQQPVANANLLRSPRPVQYTQSTSSGMIGSGQLDDVRRGNDSANPFETLAQPLGKRSAWNSQHTFRRRIAMFLKSRIDGEPWFAMLSAISGLAFWAILMSYMFEIAAH